MPWLRTGDNAATHPIVMSVHSIGEDPREVNEVFGFVMRLALQSAGHITDYVINEGTAYMIGLDRTPRLIDVAVRAGYLKPLRRSKVPAWKLIDDPEFIHMRLRSEIEWEKQQRADTSNPALIVPVRLRDGDACRYCGKIVSWSARKGALAGTYDHRVPGKPATVDLLVVCCGACNSGRRDTADADDRYPLRPPPAEPFYSPQSLAFLHKHGHDVASSPTARSADNDAESADIADSVPAESRSAGSGRVGSGRAALAERGDGSTR